MRTIILGTAGHIDHGKTALVRALTGVDTDRLPEEKKRGITIDIGFARLDLDNGTEIGIVDVPGHEAFIRNMLAGATGIDIALLVIAADEGVMPQTREHLAILQLLAVRSIIVVLSKADLVDDDWLGLVQEDVAALLRDTEFHAAPMVAVSAISGAGMDRLRDLLANVTAGLDARDADDVFRLPIDRIFTIKGTGTVVTGTVWSGSVNADSTVQILPGGMRVRVRGIQTHSRECKRAAAGQRAAIALAGIAREDLTRGDCLVGGDAWRATHIVTARLHVLSDAPEIRTRQRVRFHLGTAEGLGRIALLESAPIRPGEDGWAQIRLEQPIVARAGDRFVLRSYSPVTTIAGGRVVEPVAPKRKRISTATRNRFADILSGDSDAACSAAAGLAGLAGLELARLPTAVPPQHRQHAWTPGFRSGTAIVHPQVARDARESLLEAVTRHHSRFPLATGVPREILRQLLPVHAHPNLADAILDQAIAQGRLAADGHTLRLTDFRPQLTPAQDQAAADLETLVRAAGLAAPSLDEIPPPLANRPDLTDLAHFLQRSGRLIALSGDRWVHPANLEQAIRLARNQFDGRTDLTPSDFRDLYGISRKFLIPLLEHLDRTAVTTRSGDVRRMEPLVPGSHGGP